MRVASRRGRAQLGVSIHRQRVRGPGPPRPRQARPVAGIWACVVRQLIFFFSFVRPTPASGPRRPRRRSRAPARRSVHRYCPHLIRMPRIDMIGAGGLAYPVLACSGWLPCAADRAGLAGGRYRPARLEYMWSFKKTRVHVHDNKPFFFFIPSILTDVWCHKQSLSSQTLFFCI